MTRFLPLACALTLAACAGQPITPASVVSDAQTAVTALQTALKQVAIAEPNLIPAADLTRINADLATAATAAAQLSAGMPAATGAATAKVVEGDINDVLDVLAGPPVNGLIPAPANQVVAAAAIVAPMIEAFVAQYVPAAAASPEVASARTTLAAAAPMTLAQARAVLAGAR